MWHASESDFGYRSNSMTKARWRPKILRLLCGVVLVVLLPFSAGCSPGLLVGGAIVGSVLYAHANKDNLPTRPPRPQPTIYLGRTYASSVRPATTHLANNPPVSTEQRQPEYRPAVPPSVSQGTVPEERQTMAYESHRPADAKVTSMTHVADTPAASLPKPPVDPMPRPPAAPLVRPPAAKPPTRISPLVEGTRAYQELRWDDAVRVLGRAITNGTCTEPELSQAYVLLGAIAYQQGDAETARRHFREAHRHDPELAPSPQVFPPPLVEFYKTVNHL